MAGRLADVIVVAGDVANDVPLLGRQQNIRHVWKGSAPVDLDMPLLTRQSVSCWRIANYSTMPLTRAAVVNRED